MIKDLCLYAGIALAAGPLILFSFYWIKENRLAIKELVPFFFYWTLVGLLLAFGSLP